MDKLNFKIETYRSIVRKKQDKKNYMSERLVRKTKHFKAYLSQLLAPAMLQFHQRIMPNEIVFQENQEASVLYYLVNGSIEISKSCFNQSNIPIDHIQGGNFLGFEAIFPYGYYYCTAKAKTASLVCAVPKSTFLQLFHQYNQDSLNIMDMAFLELNAQEEMLIDYETKYLLQSIKLI